MGASSPSGLPHLSDHILWFTGARCIASARYSPTRSILARSWGQIASNVLLLHSALLTEPGRAMAIRQNASSRSATDAYVGGSLMLHTAACMEPP